ncbi:MAG: hypothetical protein RR716_05820 [Christensenellaceae bacterium]
MRNLKKMTAMLIVVILLLGIIPTGGLAQDMPEPTQSVQSEPTQSVQSEPTQSVQPIASPSTQPTVSPSVQPTEEHTKLPIVTEQPSALPTQTENQTDNYAGEGMPAPQEEKVMLPDAQKIKAMLDKLAEYQYKTIQNPSVGTTGGEWAVLALARYGAISENFKQTYLGNLYGVLEKTKGVLDKRKYTEYSRVTLALSSLGMNAQEVAGYDVIAPLADFDQVKWQGVNGTIWALIALDTMQYEVPKLPSDSTKVQTTREKLIQDILSKEVSGGGWSLMSGTSMAEVDMTGMAIAALSPYYSQNIAVKTSVDRAIAWLSQVQTESGSFGSCESDAQVIVALGAMNIPLDDARFVKNKKTVIDGLMMYYIAADGSFLHMISDGGASAMATDQGMYALVSYYRSITGQTRLYDMSDKIPKPPTPDKEKAEREAVIEGINGLPKVLGIRDKATVDGLLIRLSKLTEFEGKTAYAATLDMAKQTIQAIEQKVSSLDQDIWNRINPQNITKNSAGAVAELMGIYNSIAVADRVYLAHFQDLLDANDIIDALNQQIIPRKVFENIFANDTVYTYEGISGTYAYTISINGKNITNPSDMNAAIHVGSADAGNIMSLMKGSYWLTLAQSGTLPARISVSTQVGVPDGEYILYYYEQAGDVVQKMGGVTIQHSTLLFDTDIGGIYFIMPKTTPKKAGVKKQEQKKAAGGIIEKSMFEELQGKDINLKIDGKTKSGISYTMTFNGQDIKNPMDFISDISLQSENEKDIKLLAPNALLIHFKHHGKLPGKMLVELHGLSLPDGEYLLFYYNETEQRAQVIQKIVVKDGSTKFFLEHCSDYFIAQSAKKASIAELSMLEKSEKNVQDKPSMQTEEAENEQQEMNEVQKDISQDLPQKQQTFPLWVIIVLIAAAAVGVVFMVRTTRKKKEQL